MFFLNELCNNLFLKSKLEGLIFKSRLTLQDTDFLENVESDIHSFLKNQSRRRVLLFPPFNNFRRCLVHQTVEHKFKDLKSFSIGEEENRRTVVCFSKDFRSALSPPSLKINLPLSTEAVLSENQSFNNSELNQENSKRVKRVRTMPSVSIYRPPAARKLEQNANISNLSSREMVGGSSPEKNKLKCVVEEKEVCQSLRKIDSNGMSVFRNAITSIRAQNKVPKCKNVENINKKNESDTKICKSEEVVKSNAQNRQRRPDIQVYVPKGRRSSNLLVEPKSSVEEKSSKSNELVPEQKIDCSEEKSKEKEPEPQVIDITESEVTLNDTQTEPLPKSTLKTLCSSQENINCHTVNTVDTVNCAECCDTTNSKKKQSVMHLNPEECDWESMFDDTGECLNPSLLDQLTTAVGEVTIEKPKSNYNEYKTKSLDMVADEFPHVIEIYNFPPEFQLHDLMTVFSQFKNSGFEIKWVDDTHALGIFSSSAIVSEVLSFYHPFVKTRSLKEGTPLSKMKARRSAEFLLPYKPRPDTCPALARRLVTGALGVKLPTSREEREAERKILTKAREKKRLEAKQKEDAWEGTFS